MIEQTLMGSVKTLSGLTRGCRMNELQRSIWLLSIPVIAKVNQVMLDFTGVKYQTSDQLKILSLSRIQRDHQDAQKNF